MPKPLEKVARKKVRYLVEPKDLVKKIGTYNPDPRLKRILQQQGLAEKVKDKLIGQNIKSFHIDHLLDNFENTDLIAKLEATRARDRAGVLAGLVTEGFEHPKQEIFDAVLKELQNPKRKEKADEIRDILKGIKHTIESNEQSIELLRRDFPDDVNTLATLENQNKDLIPKAEALQRNINALVDPLVAKADELKESEREKKLVKEAKQLLGGDLDPAKLKQLSRNAGLLGLYSTTLMQATGKKKAEVIGKIKNVNVPLRTQVESVEGYSRYLDMRGYYDHLLSSLGYSKKNVDKNSQKNKNTAATNVLEAHEKRLAGYLGGTGKTFLSQFVRMQKQAVESAGASPADVKSHIKEMSEQATNRLVDDLTRKVENSITGLETDDFDAIMKRAKEQISYAAELLLQPENTSVTLDMIIKELEKNTALEAKELLASKKPVLRTDIKRGVAKVLIKEGEPTAKAIRKIKKLIDELGDNEYFELAHIGTGTKIHSNDVIDYLTGINHNRARTELVKAVTEVRKQHEDNAEFLTHLKTERVFAGAGKWLNEQKSKGEPFEKNEVKRKIEEDVRKAKKDFDAKKKVVDTSLSKKEADDIADDLDKTLSTLTPVIGKKEVDKQIWAWKQKYGVDILEDPDIKASIEDLRKEVDERDPDKNPLKQLEWEVMRDAIGDRVKDHWRRGLVDKGRARKGK